MNEIQLDVQIREEKGRRFVKKMRQGDFVPAVVYGGEKKVPTTIQVNRRAYEKIMRAHQGQSVVFHLNVMEGEKKLRDYAAIVKEEQLHPVKDDLLHLDFLRISLKQEIEVKSPIALVGEAEGVKKDKGSLDQPLHELDILCLPTNIPEKIEVNIEALQIGDAIHVRDLALPAGVTSRHDPDAIVASVVPPMRDEEEVIDPDAEPEVIGEKEGEAATEEAPKEEASAEGGAEKKDG